MKALTLFGRPGWGSAIIEAQLVWYGRDFNFVDVGDLFRDADARETLRRINPVAQMPAVEFADGAVMTESAAITLFLAEAAEAGGRASLAPSSGAPDRADFLRWLIFIVANIYPTYTYGDEPARFVPDELAREGFAERTGAYARELYARLDEAAGEPWFLGARMSAIDVYIATMTHWRPRRAWFAAHAPRLSAIALAIEAEPRFGDVWRRNFPEAGP